MALDCQSVFSHFQVEGRFKSAIPYGSGHINDTFLVSLTNGVHYILQRINPFVFKEPLKLMENVQRVTEHITRKVTESGGDPMRESLRLYPTVDGASCYRDADGSCWRVYQFVSDTVGYDQISNPQIAYQGGLAYAQFQTYLVDLPGPPLNETIPHFNHPGFLFQRLIDLVEADSMNRAQSVAPQIDFAMQRGEAMQHLSRLVESGQIPLRITHNDTKINNVLIDAKTNQAKCVIDLDTVMSGCCLNDYGDSIRTGAAKAPEDEPDLSKVGLNYALFDAFTKGYLTAAKPFLTPLERDNMAFAVRLYPYVIGLRFLNDYLEGDPYFKIHHENHNAQRCKAQFQLTQTIEQDYEAIVRRIERVYHAVH